uniref:Putative ovule protein n=1 Tax=Solanum chacoense TaxID=4108 RepID=A0A0V0H275_SOLCH
MLPLIPIFRSDKFLCRKGLITLLVGYCFDTTFSYLEQAMVYSMFRCSSSYICREHQCLTL